MIIFWNSCRINFISRVLFLKEWFQNNNENTRSTVTLKQRLAQVTFKTISYPSNIYLGPIRYDATRVHVRGVTSVWKSKKKKQNKHETKKLLHVPFEYVILSTILAYVVKAFFLFSFFFSERTWRVCKRRVGIRPDFHGQISPQGKKDRFRQATTLAPKNGCKRRKRRQSIHASRVSPRDWRRG